MASSVLWLEASYKENIIKHNIYDSEKKLNTKMYEKYLSIDTQIPGFIFQPKILP